MKDILKFIKKSKTIALFSHISPDPDTIGSTMGLYYALKLLKKDVYLFCDDENLERFSFVDAEKIYNTADPSQKYDLALAVDIAALDRLGKYEEVFKHAIRNARLDHHKSGENFAEYNLMIPYAACGMLIYEIIIKLKIKINSQIASLLYFAICGDTGGFRFSNTDSKTFDICARLLEKGADIRRIYAEFFDKKTVHSLKLTSYALINAEFDDEVGFAFMKLRKNDYEKFGADESEYVGNLPNMYLNCGYKIACILKEKSDGIRASLRSKFEYDCSQIAERFGGGGHKNASGISFSTEESFEEIETKLKLAIKEFLITNKGDNL